MICEHCHKENRSIAKFCKWCGRPMASQNVLDRLVGLDDVKAQLKDGYLTVTATRQSSLDDDKNEKFIRRERYMGSVTRSFYVGKTLTEEDIKAKFDNGTLILSLPKVPEKKVEEDRYIAIEG